MKQYVLCFVVSILAGTTVAKMQLLSTTKPHNEELDWVIPVQMTNGIYTLTLQHDKTNVI